jgi:methionyl aminopeptidase
MITAGAYDIVVDEDGWSIFTTDQSLAAHFEHTVAITDDGPRILTLAQGTSIVDAEI